MDVGHEVLTLSERHVGTARRGENQEGLEEQAAWDAERRVLYHRGGNEGEG